MASASSLRVAGCRRLADRVCEVRRPVAVAPVDGQVDAAPGELRLERGLERAVLRVDGAHAAEVAVVVRDLFEPLVGDAAPARDVAKERDDVLLPFGSAEAGEQDRVVGDGHLHERGPGGRGIRCEQHCAALVDMRRFIPRLIAHGSILTPPREGRRPPGRPRTRRYDGFIMPLSNRERPLYEVKANLFKGLAHPFRIRILELLSASAEMNVADLQAETGLEASHLSQHLAVLRRHRLVESQRRASHVYYRLADPRVADLLAVARALLLAVLSADRDLLADAEALPPLAGSGS